MATTGSSVKLRPSPPRTSTNGITPPGTACRVLPLFSPPGCHCYDAYLNCFQHRPEVRARLREAARRHAAHRHDIHHNEGDVHGEAHRGSAADAAAVQRGHFPVGAAPQLSVEALASSRGTTSRRAPSCRCGLQATQLFASRYDVPSPPLPLSKCELHEVLQSLPPRWQNYPWQLCFDTARDGFSLSTFYRCMEGVEAQQSRAKTVAFGLFFVRTREDAPVQHAGVMAYPSAASPTDAGTPTSLVSAAPYGGSSASVSLVGTPSTAGNSKSFSIAHHSSSMRYGAARGTLPFSVIGCFTPEVPSLTHHAANVYFGSAESSVFRLDQLGESAQRGEWMLQAFDAAERDVKEPSEAKSVDAAASCKAASRESRGNVFLLSSHTGRATQSMQGLTSLAGSEQQSGVPVPLPTHTTIEHSNQGTEVVKEAAAAAGTAPPSPTISHPTSPSRRTSGTAPRYSLRAAAAVGVVPRAPLVAKYGWSGRPDNRKFIVCNPHFLALGAGKSGAALYIDGALQFGTSSNWCETYDAPCLFGPRPSHTASASSLNALAQGSVSGGAAAAGGIPATLPHREFAVSRVVWFAITEGKKDFRVMSSDAAAAGVSADGDALRCRCGRVGCGGEAEVGGAGPLSAAEWPSYAHQCDLLPFTEQPY